jgi:hypothetical protein
VKTYSNHFQLRHPLFHTSELLRSLVDVDLPTLASLHCPTSRSSFFALAVGGYGCQGAAEFQITGGAGEGREGSRSR